MVTRADVVAEARRWLDTPFHHQARLRGVGADCVGLAGGVAVELGLVPPTFWRAVDREYGGYARQPSAGRLPAALARFLDPLPRGSEQPGDVVLMRFKREPMHVAILADYMHGGVSIVHALARPGLVAEHGLDSRWRDRIVAAYAFPGVT